MAPRSLHQFLRRSSPLALLPSPITRFIQPTKLALQSRSIITFTSFPDASIDYRTTPLQYSNRITTTTRTLRPYLWDNGSHPFPGTQAIIRTITKWNSEFTAPVARRIRICGVLENDLHWVKQLIRQHEITVQLLLHMGLKQAILENDEFSEEEKGELGDRELVVEPPDAFLPPRLAFNAFVEWSEYAEGLNWKELVTVNGVSAKDIDFPGDSMDAEITNEDILDLYSVLEPDEQAHYRSILKYTYGLELLEKEWNLIDIFWLRPGAE